MNNIKKPYQSLVHESLTSETHTSFELIGSSNLNKIKGNESRQRMSVLPVTYNNKLLLLQNWHCLWCLDDGTASHTQVKVSIHFAQPRHTCTVAGHLIGGLCNFDHLQDKEKKKQSFLFVTPQWPPPKRCPPIGP